ncbi:cold-shock protein [Streptomyces silvisoli]|uniref:Cold shock domain-containing protein n=1 Tax=Streptomyces silvisoli TaxID=3034235 RepID=A0ABT5ZSI2_9ACTN|nr:cold shock domain-containing protein [Streptomyces silvisoli]MDF3292691.1 cold shock domain-containing protein [Streptomyces silvisoli]
MKWFSLEKGRGVITRDDGGEPDTIVHCLAVKGCCRVRGPMAGDGVIFDVVKDSEGVRAENVWRGGAYC